MDRVIWLFLGVSVCLIPSCYRPIARLSLEEVSSSAELFEARYADLPLPLGSVISSTTISDKPSDGRAICNYRVNMRGDAVKGFYEKEMEFWGWDLLLSSVSTNEYMLVFQKPGKSCVAIHIVQCLQKKNTYSLVSLFLQ